MNLSNPGREGYEDSGPMDQRFDNNDEPNYYPPQYTEMNLPDNSIKPIEIPINLNKTLNELADLSIRDKSSKDNDNPPNLISFDASKIGFIFGKSKSSSLPKIGKQINSETNKAEEAFSRDVFIHKVSILQFTNNYPCSIGMNIGIKNDKKLVVCLDGETYNHVFLAKTQGTNPITIYEGDQKQFPDIMNKYNGWDLKRIKKSIVPTNDGRALVEKLSPIMGAWKEMKESGSYDEAFDWNVADQGKFTFIDRELAEACLKIIESDLGSVVIDPYKNLQITFDRVFTNSDEKTTRWVNLDSEITSLAIPGGKPWNMTQEKYDQILEEQLNTKFNLSFILRVEYSPIGDELNIQTVDIPSK